VWSNYKKHNEECGQIIKGTLKSVVKYKRHNEEWSNYKGHNEECGQVIKGTMKSVVKL
jgi:hypothetical protein